MESSGLRASRRGTDEFDPTGEFYWYEPDRREGTSARRSDVSRTLVRYKVKPEQAACNEELVRRVYEELQRTTPAGLRYATFVLEDGVSFVHVASVETEDAHNPLSDVAAFRTFQEGIGDRCEEPSAGQREVGSYGFWAGV
jgi:hypothetical protein